MSSSAARRAMARDRRQTMRTMSAVSPSGTSVSSPLPRCAGTPLASSQKRVETVSTEPNPIRGSAAQPRAQMTRRGSQPARAMPSEPTRTALRHDSPARAARRPRRRFSTATSSSSSGPGSTDGIAPPVIGPDDTQRRGPGERWSSRPPGPLRGAGPRGPAPVVRRPGPACTNGPRRGPGNRTRRARGRGPPHGRREGRRASPQSHHGSGRRPLAPIDRLRRRLR